MGLWGTRKDTKDALHRGRTPSYVTVARGFAGFSWQRACHVTRPGPAFGPALSHSLKKLRAAHVAIGTLQAYAQRCSGESAPEFCFGFSY